MTRAGKERKETKTGAPSEVMYVQYMVVRLQMVTMETVDGTHATHVPQAVTRKH